MSERPETRMKSIPSRLAVDNSLNGRFGMKSEPVNYSICNAVRIADTKSIIEVMQIRSDKLILLFPKANRTSIIRECSFWAFTQVVRGREFIKGDSIDQESVGL